MTGLAFLSLLGSAVPAAAGHGDAVTGVILGLVVILVAAKLGGDLAVRVGQPAVLGELLAGVVVGNLGLVGVHALDGLGANAGIDLLAQLGVLLLLFEVGLESTVKEMLAVGVRALLVATVGVAVPFALGWAAAAWLAPQASPYAHAFAGATLCATSVGITARVLKDLGRSQSREARIILGAAVIDDVMGLVILAVVTGAIGAAGAGGGLSLGAVGIIVAKAAGFLVVAIAAGVLLSGPLFRAAARLRARGVLLASGLVVCFALSYLAALVAGVLFSGPLFRAAARLRARGVLLASGLVVCFALSYLAAVIGLAPIVGAFAAGLVLEEAHFERFVHRGERGLEELLVPVGDFLVPVFFVLMGIRTDLRSFAEPGVLGLAAALTVAAIAGKAICGLAAGRMVDRLSVGIGMIPRGEVGLIFANIGLGLTVAGAAVVSRSTFSALVVMVITTTLVTPPALKATLSRRGASREAVGESRAS